MRIFESILDDINTIETSDDRNDISVNTLSPEHYHYCLAFPSPEIATMQNIRQRFVPLFELYTSEYHIIITEPNIIPECVEMKLHSTIIHPAEVKSRIYIEFNTTKLNKLDPMFIINIGATLFVYYNKDYIYPSVVIPDILHSEKDEKYVECQSKMLAFYVSNFYDYICGKLSNKMMKNTSEAIFSIISETRSMLLDPRDIREYLTKRLNRRKQLIKQKKSLSKK